MKNKHFLLFGALFAMLAVLLGALAAHGLEKWVDANRLQRFHTGVEYQFYHAFALLFTGLYLQTPLTRHAVKRLQYAGMAFTLGILLFSGSLYAYVLSGVRSFGMITPFGGVAFIVGWVCVLLAIRHASAHESDQ